ncbi:MAG: hypothetical protein ACM31O_14495 [Bacteroidota bacterium]
MTSLLGLMILGGLAIGTVFRVAAIIAVSVAVVVVGLLAGIASGQPLRQMGVGIICALTALQVSYLLAVLASLVCRGWCARYLWPQRP